VRIGLIQTRGIGDIIIALPLAQFLLDRGHEVLWPIDSRFLPSFQAANPDVRFLPVIHPSPAAGPRGPKSYFLDEPLRQLRAAGCEVVHMLYSHLGGAAIARPDLAPYLKFDEYKYAVAEVPFAEKWRLSLRRDREREALLFSRVVPSEPYIVVHTEGSDATVPSTAIAELARGRPVVEIRPLSDNVFDWLQVIERASGLLMIDSCYSNLVEQLGLPATKHLWLRTPSPFTPVYRNGWVFMDLAGTPPAGTRPPSHGA
jgi:hypothetical protein